MNDAHRSDVELVRAALSGDREAAGRLAERMRYASRVLAAHNLRRGRPLDDEELADVAQEAIVALWSRLPAYRGEAALESWVYPFCLNAYVNAARKKQRRAPIVALSRDGSLPEQFVETSLSAAELEPVHAALAKLGPPREDVIRMKHFDELTFDAIAARLAVPVETVKTWYYRGLRALGSSLSAWHREDGE